MEPIPGSDTAPEATAPAGIEALNTTAPRSSSTWWTSPRWSNYGGEKPPMTQKRTAAIAAKRTGVVQLEDGSTLGGGEDGYASKPNAKPKNWLQECATASELRAGFANGKLFAYPIENRRGKEYVPTTSTAAKWKMRAPHMRVLSVIAGAMIGMKARGVVIAHKELAALATSSGRRVIGLEERQVGTVVRELCAWGLLRTTPVFVPKGAVTSQRGSCYRLTTLAAGVYRLKLPAACGDLPEPVLRELPPKNPRTGSGRDRQSLPANPETPLRGSSPEEHAAFPRSEVNRLRAHAASCATSERTPAGVAAAGALPSSAHAPSPRAIAVQNNADGDACNRSAAPMCPTDRRTHHSLGASSRTDALSDGSMSRESRTPAICPSTAPSREAAPELELARRAGDAVTDVRRDRVDERYVENADGTCDRRETDRRLRLARGRVIADEKADLKRRQEAQLELVRSREAERASQRDRRANRGPEIEDDDLAQPAGGVIDPAIDDALRKYRDSVRDENAGNRYNLQPAIAPRPPRDPDADFDDVIARTLHSRFGNELPPQVALALDKLRRTTRGDKS